jgi:hypothetical protein
MNFLKPALLVLMAFLSLGACTNTNADKQSKEDPSSDMIISNDLQIYYFHNTKRCATCNAVEDETKMALELFYAEQMQAGTIEFISLNIEVEQGKRIAERLEVSGQTLLLVKGETRLNLTNEAFMNARTNPTAFHEILATNIDKLL